MRQDNYSNPPVHALRAAHALRVNYLLFIIIKLIGMKGKTKSYKTILYYIIHIGIFNYLKNYLIEF